MTNNHLVKRLEKMKANRNALLSQQWGRAAIHTHTHTHTHTYTHIHIYTHTHKLPQPPISLTLATPCPNPKRTMSTLSHIHSPNSCQSREFPQTPPPPPINPLQTVNQTKNRPPKPGSTGLPSSTPGCVRRDTGLHCGRLRGGKGASDRRVWEVDFCFVFFLLNLRKFQFINFFLFPKLCTWWCYSNSGGVLHYFIFFLSFLCCKVAWVNIRAL